MWLLSPPAFWLPSNLCMSDVLFLGSRIFVCFLKNSSFFSCWDFLFIYYMHIWYPSSQFWELPSEFSALLQQLILLGLVLVTLFSLGDICLFVSMSRNFGLYPGSCGVLAWRDSAPPPVRQQQQPRLPFSQQPGRVEPALWPSAPVQTEALGT